MTDSSSATSLPLPSALYWSALGRWGVLIGDVEDELAALSWRLEADELVERAPRGKYSTLTEPPERLTRIDVGLPTPSPQRVRLNPHPGPDPIHRSVQRQRAVLLPSLSDHPLGPLPKLLRVLPRC